MAKFNFYPIRDLCINRNNHQNAIFRQLDNFIKHSHSFAMTIFHKITNSEKLVILLIIPTYAKVSINNFFNPCLGKTKSGFKKLPSEERLLSQPLKNPKQPTIKPPLNIQNNRTIF